MPPPFRVQSYEYDITGYLNRYYNLVKTASCGTLDSMSVLGGNKGKSRRKGKLGVNLR